jgi:hypothetical protein
MTTDESRLTVQVMRDSSFVPRTRSEREQPTETILSVVFATSLIRNSSST